MENKKETTLIAFLGGQKRDKEKCIQSYTETTYKFANGESFLTMFSFESILAMESISKLVLVGTKESCWFDVYNRFATNKNQTYMNDLEEEIIKKIRPNLSKIEKAIQSKYPLVSEVQTLIIEYGKEESELEDTFVKLTQLRPLLERGAYRIIIDITNSFRSIPIHIFLFTKYMDKIVGANIPYELYYGMFEAKENDVTPMVNLAVLNDLIKWIEAISEFRTTGNVDSLSKLMEDLPIGDSIKDFREGTDRNSLKFIYKSIGKIKRLSQEDRKEFEENRAISQGVKEILLTIAKEFDDVFTEVNDSEEVYRLVNFQLKLAYWYYKQNRIGLSTSIATEALTSILSYTAYGEDDKIFTYKARRPVNEVWRDSEPKGRYKEIHESNETLKENVRNIFAHCGCSSNSLDIIGVKQQLARFILGLKWMQTELHDSTKVIPFSEQIKEELGNGNFLESNVGDVQAFQNDLVRKLRDIKNKK